MNRRKNIPEPFNGGEWGSSPSKKYDFESDAVDTIDDCDPSLNGAEDFETPSEDFSPDAAADALSPAYSGSRGSANKRKIAPRSGQQFKVGPSFENTTLYKPIHLESSDEKVFPFVKARIDRGFDLINNEWIGYKRNYFTLVAAFEFENHGLDVFSKEKFYTFNNEGNKINIKYFAIRLISKCCENDMQINLIQHTAKRDRGPQFKPPIYVAVTGTLPSHEIIKQSANIRNENKIDLFSKLFYYDWPREEGYKDTILGTYPNSEIATVARYERIQFSTSINYRKPAMVNRHFVLKVELLGHLEDDEYSVLASTETPPLIVRGRSPSNYQLAKMTAKSNSERPSAVLENRPLEKRSGDRREDDVWSTDNLYKIRSTEPIEQRANNNHHQSKNSPMKGSLEEEFPNIDANYLSYRSSSDIDNMISLDFDQYQEPNYKYAKYGDHPRGFSDSFEHTGKNPLTVFSEQQPNWMSEMDRFVVDENLDPDGQVDDGIYEFNDDYEMPKFLNPSVTMKNCRETKSLSRSKFGSKWHTERSETVLSTIYDVSYQFQIENLDELPALNYIEDYRI